MVTLTDAQFRRIASTAKSRWGLDLTEKKLPLVASRLARFLRKSDFADVEAYLKHLESSATEQDQLLFFDLLSTNVTSFYREQGAFDFLERELWTPLSRGTLSLPGRKIRIWSAACSTGPEPYTIAMHAHDHLANFDRWELRIEASDLAVSVLETARRGVYPRKMVERLDPELVKRHFLRGRDQADGFVRVVPELRRLVSFSCLNLMDPWPWREPFDVIFCRNCMIYFDKPTRDALIARFHEQLRPGGVLVIGSSETLTGCPVPFRTVQPSVYRK